MVRADCSARRGRLRSTSMTATQSDEIPAELLDAERERRKRDTVAGYHILASFGWGDDGAGHISARDPEETDSFWLLRCDAPCRRAAVDDLVLVRPGGTTASGEPINPAAFCIHGPIHVARPDVVSAVH